MQKNQIRVDIPAETYQAVIARMLANIHDKRTLAMIYKYVVYLYTRK